MFLNQIFILITNATHAQWQELENIKRYKIRILHDSFFPIPPGNDDSDIKNYVFLGFIQSVFSPAFVHLCFLQ